VAVGDGYAVAVGDGYVVEVAVGDGYVVGVGVGVGVGVAVGDGYVVGVGVGVAVAVGVGVGVVDLVETGVGLEDGGDELRPGDGERDGLRERSDDGESDPCDPGAPARADGWGGLADDADRVWRDPGRGELVTGTAAGLGGSPLAAASG
jgi:hypothetical protein